MKTKKSGRNLVTDMVLGCTLLFVYGRLAGTQLLERLLGRVPHRELAFICGMKMVKKKGMAHFTLKEDPQGVVVGCLLRGITPEEWRVLDEYEEVNRGLYQRVQMRLRMTADVYI